MQLDKFTMVVSWLTLSIVLLTDPITITAGEPEPTSAQWEPAIKAFEAADMQTPPPREGVLFVGSSSIRLWKTLTNDFSDLPVLQRGFGGSQMADLLAYADRIVLAYRPKVIVVYEGDNDLAAGREPEAVFQAYKKLSEKVQAALPHTRLICISIKPSPSRWHLVDKARQTNRLIEDYSKAHEQLRFVDVFHSMLDDQGQPRRELFIEDNLHMNAQGYQIWTRLLRPEINEAMRATR